MGGERRLSASEFGPPLAYFLVHAVFIGDMVLIE
jgi:hypothetical protein